MGVPHCIWYILVFYEVLEGFLHTNTLGVDVWWLRNASSGESTCEISRLDPAPCMLTRLTRIQHSRTLRGSEDVGGGGGSRLGTGVIRARNSRHTINHTRFSFDNTVSGLLHGHIPRPQLPLVCRPNKE